jgi:hypothetical protein
MKSESELPKFKFNSPSKIAEDNEYIVGTAILETMSGPAAGNVRLISGVSMITYKVNRSGYKTMLIAIDGNGSKYFNLDAFGTLVYDREASTGYFRSQETLYKIRQPTEADMRSIGVIKTQYTI